MIPATTIWQAKKQIKPWVAPTPLIESKPLSQQTGATISLKLETAHEIGAFKIRGAANKILSLPQNERNRGVTTFSTGNHGLAVSFIAQKLGIKAVICVSKHIPQAKIDAIERFGGEVECYGESQDEAALRCKQLQNQQGMTVIKPFDDKEIIAGQGTIGLELLEDAPDLDSVFVPLSGGGLASGIALALKANNPAIHVYGVCQEQSAVMYESLQAGHPIEREETSTLADSLLGGIGLNNEYTFILTQHYLDEIFLVSETSIAQGMAYMMEQHRIMVEGAAATGIGALFDGVSGPIGNHSAVIITGHNVDISTYWRAVAGHLTLP